MNMTAEEYSREFDAMYGDHTPDLPASKAEQAALRGNRPKISDNLEEAAEKQINEALFKWSYDDEDGIEQYVHDAFIAGADFGAKKMLAKLKENCVIIDKDFYEAAMEGRFIEGKEEGKKLMEEQNRKKEDER